MIPTILPPTKAHLESTEGPCHVIMIQTYLFYISWINFSSFSGTRHLLFFTHRELAMKLLIVLYENVIKPRIWMFRLVTSFKILYNKFQSIKEKKYQLYTRVCFLDLLFCWDTRCCSLHKHCKIFSATEFFSVLSAYPHQLPVECRLFQGLFLAEAYLCLHIARN